ncbi:MAG: pilus assembly protein N-terminal domain-containing protein, partial [Pirellulaceae bacterium]|nr:pilus assembly protein N-terminal domain-containing protein [Pirellulaceae bacterium]
MKPVAAESPAADDVSSSDDHRSTETTARTADYSFATPELNLASPAWQQPASDDEVELPAVPPEAAEQPPAPADDPPSVTFVPDNPLLAGAKPTTALPGEPPIAPGPQGADIRPAVSPQRVAIHISDSPSPPTEQPAGPPVKVQVFDRADSRSHLPAATPSGMATPLKTVGFQPGAAPADDEPFEVIEQAGELSLQVRRSKLLRTRQNVYRTAVVDPEICDILQFTPRELSVIGRAEGATHVTLWFEGEDQKPLTYLVRVVPDAEEQRRAEEEFQLLEDMLADLFPDSKVRLLVMADKLIVKGQAKDSEEASQILTVVRNQTG